MTGLSPETVALVQRIFLPEQQAEVERLLVERCGNNLPFMGDADETTLERIRYAVLKLSKGNLDALRSSIRLAEQDWRDAFMNAGFGNDLMAHKKWATQILE